MKTQIQIFQHKQTQPIHCGKIYQQKLKEATAELAKAQST